MRITKLRSALCGSVLVIALLALAPAGPAQAADLLHVPSDVPTIQAAMDAVAGGGTVVVAPGVYREHLNFNGRDVEVRSAAGPEATVIDGGGDGAVVLFQRRETRATSLRGFTVRNGEIGVEIRNASPTIAGNIVTANTFYEGAGFNIAGSSALIEDNVVRGNTATGGRGGGFHLVDTSGLEIVDNVIEENTAPWGGGIAMWTGWDVLVANNVFRANRATIDGGAMDIVNYSDPLITQNLFVDNVATGSGGAVSVTVPVFMQGAVLANNTMAGNRAAKGSAINSNGDYFGVNNIIAGPPGVEVVRCEGGAGRLFYNDVYNGTAAPFRWCPDTTGLVGNISVDPRLAADFSLSPGSPAIDAGHDDPLLPLLRPTDANGAPRVVDGNGDGAAVDLGAFEWPGAGMRSPAPIPGAYHPVFPARILDTRSGLGAPGRLGPRGQWRCRSPGRAGCPRPASRPWRSTSPPPSRAQLASSPPGRPARAVRWPPASTTSRARRCPTWSSSRWARGAG